MTNTTEEIIRTIRKGFITENRSTVCNEIPFVADAVDYTVERVFALPLADRLTQEEKERVKVVYNEELGMAQHFHLKAKASNDISCRQHYYGLREPYISRMKLLERIFGADFFKEGK